ncbi:regulator of sigma E protease [Elusimicrobium simillimum]|uniref:M50 family metallopeptidase n=1 Tax=Elusimicrobium simillimum TaxID=3143438 RepID=UPI003C70605C
MFSSISSGVITLIAVLVALSPIVLIHEFGHYIVCRMVGIRVYEFSFGFGRLLWSKKVGHTQYSLRAIPFGGYVNPAGEMFVDKDKETPKDYEFASKAWWKKLLMVLSGAIMNYVLAFIVFTLLVIIMGTPETDINKIPPVVGAVVQGHPAAIHGMKEGDKILTINATAVTTWAQMTDAITANKTDMKLTYQRGEEITAVTIPLKDFDGKAVLGIQMMQVYKKATPLGAIRDGAYQCYYWTHMSLSSIYKSFAAKKAPDLAGPVGIINIIHTAVHTDLMYFLWLIGLLSLAVGMFNLFPIPILDGGYALVFIWEGITGKIPSEKAINKALNVGFTLIIILVLYATFGDVKRIFFKASAEKPAAVETVETGK